MEKVENGDQVRDRITGFEGVVTGCAEYITGCRQCSVTAVSREGKPGEVAWFDDDRLEVTQKGAVVLARGRDGGPQSHPAPTR